MDMSLSRLPELVMDRDWTALNLCFLKFYLCISTAGNGSCLSGENSHCIGPACTRLRSGQPSLPASPSVPGRHVVPLMVPSHLFLLVFQLLVGVPCHEATGGQCLLSATVRAAQPGAALSVPKDTEKSPFFASFSPLSQGDMTCITEPYPLCLQASAHRLRNESVEFRQGAKVREKTLFLCHAPFCTPGLFPSVVPPSQTSSSRPFPSV